MNPGYELTEENKKRKGDWMDDLVALSKQNKKGSKVPFKLVTYNRDYLPKIRKMEQIKISTPYQHAHNSFKKEIEKAKAIEASTKNGMIILRKSIKDEYGIDVVGGDPVTISWMLYIEGPNDIDVTATSIREAVMNRRVEMFEYIRSFVGVNEEGTDRFALDWKEGVPVFNEYRCSFPIYFPGVCIKLSRSGAHITGPKNIEDFLGVAEFVRGLYTKVSIEEDPHMLKAFSMDMLNVSINLKFASGKRNGTDEEREGDDPVGNKATERNIFETADPLHVSDNQGDKAKGEVKPNQWQGEAKCKLARVFPNREAIYKALTNGLKEANGLQVGSLWNMSSNRCCVTNLKYAPKAVGKKLGYAGVNFNYLVHGENHAGIGKNVKIHGKQPKQPKWPWISMFDKGKLIAIFTNPSFVVKTIKFIVEFLSEMIVDVEHDSDAEKEEDKEEEEDEDNDEWYLDM